MRLVVEVPGDVEESAGERVPAVLGDRRAGMSLDCGAHLVAKLLVGPVPAGDANDREPFGQPGGHGQVVERRHQLARRSDRPKRRR